MGKVRWVRCILSVFYLTFLSSLTPAVADTPRTLSEILTIALKQNTDVKKAEEEVKSEAAGIIVARASLLPDVEVTGNFDLTDKSLIPRFGDETFGTDTDWEAGIEFAQPLYSGGKGSSNLAAERFRAEAAKLKLEQIVSETVLLVTERYYEVLLARRELGVREESLRLLEEELKSEQSKLSAGSVSEFNVLRAEVAVANSRAPLIRARNNVNLAHEELDRALGVPEGEESGRSYAKTVVGEFSYQPFRAPLEESIETATKRRPELRRTALLIQAAKKGVVFERADFHPRIKVNASYNFEKSRFSDDIDESLDGWRAGLELEWNVFDSFRTTSRIAQAESAVRVAELEARQLRRDIELEVRRQFLSIREARALVEASRKVVAQAEESLRLARSRFEAGVATQLDVLDAQLALSEAKTNKIQALFEHSVAVVRMKRAMGVLGGR